MRLNAPLTIPAVFLALFLAVPLLSVLVQAGDADAWAWLASPYARGRILGAALQATLSVALTLALALPLAWHHHARALPFSSTQMAIHAAPFVLPVFVIVHGVQQMLGNGGWTARLTGLDVLAAIGPLGAIVVAHAYYNYGFAARLIHAALERRPHHLEEAAATLGATGAGAFWRVTAPMLAPAVGSVALLVFLFSFTSFGVVLWLGQGQHSTLETLIYQNLGGVLPRTGRAAALGVLQVGINVLLLVGYLRLFKRAHWPRRTVRPGPGASWGHSLGSYAAVALAVAPLLAVLSGGFQVRGEWTLEPWRALLDADHPGHLAGFHLGEVVGRTLAYAAASMVASVALAVSLAYGLERAGRLRGLAETVAAVPLGTSSVLLGFGYLLAFGAGSLLDLRGRFIGIVIVHTLVAFPFVARALLPAFQQRDQRLDEAAATLGAPPRAVAGRLHLPLLRAPLMAAAGFAIAMSLGDFGASLLLMQTDTMSLTVWISRHDQPFRLLLQAEAVALSGVLLVLAAGAYILVEKAGREVRAWD